MSRNSQATVVHRADSAVRYANELVRAIIADLPAAASLAWRLACQNIRARYRRAFLGMLWAMLPPFAITLGFSLAHRANVFQVPETALPYPVYVLVGTVLWQIFAECLEGPYNGLEGARSYITRVLFPREAFLGAQFLEIGFSACIRVGVAVAFAAGMGVTLKASILLLPFVALSVLIVGFALGLLLAPGLVLFGDAIHLLRLILAYGLFLAPVVYPPPTEGLFSWIVAINPVTPLMILAREVFSGWELAAVGSAAVMVCAGVVGLGLGILLMRITLPFLLERMLIGGR